MNPFGALAAILALRAGAAWGGPAAGPPAFGALVLLPGGGREWAATLDSLRKELSPKFPIEFAEATDVRALDKGLARLKSRKPAKIVAVPMLLSSHSAAMDHARFLFGIREEPSRAFLGGRPGSPGGRRVRRASSPLPTVLALALDDHPEFAAAVAARAKALSRAPDKESVLLAVPAIKADLENSQLLGTLQNLAERVRLKGGFKAVEVFPLVEDGRQAEREKLELAIRRRIKELSRGGRALVVPLTIGRGASERRIRKALEGTFARFDGRPPLPDPAIARWIEDSAAAGAKLPDMRVYKDGVALSR